MATFNCSNTVASQALKGESVTVKLSGAQSLSIIPLLVIGQACNIASSSKAAIVYSIDTYGHSFKMVPKQPSDRAESDTQGILKVNELITVTL